ncbi:exopolyphosphatase [Marmoricola sp. Leaf446]|uniref:acyclic terpene utilization AtuA family protein n=1 Tax=Marmoricola sp. Leaf446 TaxID=1736379 RepID=UPI0006FAA6A9|nr:acyclic terpene utilization AtuA family protein [Marmoricola sp. Leaf446]KQT90696.1 exopolyphosphatase [Marmoricola sp. Leaf446]
MSGVLRIANCSGFYGDRLSAMREVLEGGSDGQGVDVVTGDYLAELTMLILGRDRMRDAGLGYARTFVRQAEDCLGLALERGVRIVSNAGGLNPAGLAARLREVAEAQGLSPRIAWVDGDDLAPQAASHGWDDALTANAYLGGWGIARALAAGADVVVTGRVTDASVVVGPAAWHHGWTPADLDALAGAMVAGHVLECGTQATGGNFSGFLDLPRDARPLGFPLAEVAADGSAVVTKHAGTGGAVTVDTVTAQLLYEVQSTHYLGPDVSVDLASVALDQEGPDRVRIAGVRGLPPPERLKVCVNALGGWRNSLELVLTGLDLEEKEAWVRAQLESSLRADSVTWSRSGSPVADADTEEAASLRLRVTVRDPDQEVVGKAFTAPGVELALASYPGFTLTAPPGPASPYGVYRAAYVDRAAVTHSVHLPDGSVEVVPEEVAQRPSRRVVADAPGAGGLVTGLRPSSTTRDAPAAGPTHRVPLGTFVHARSGDKGGDANVGLWVRSGEKQAERAAWLLDLVTPDLVRTLLPEAADLDVEVHPLPNLHGVNVLLRGLLGEGVAASTRFDPQAKAVGEWIRSRHVEIPEELL